MIVRFKNISLLVIVLLGLFASSTISYAADTFKVSAGTSEIEALDDGRYLIPVIIEGNKGIMGFKISLKYDKAKIKVISMSKGVITAKGNFMTSIDNDTTGTADVIWNYTSQITENTGSLFYVIADISSGKNKIDVSYSQEDTFNEKYKDVILDCESIVVDLTETSENQSSVGNSDSAEPKGESSTSDEEKKDQGPNDIITEEQAKEIAIREYISKTSNPLNNSDSAKKAFKDVVAKQLEEEGYKKTADIPEDKRDDFIRNVKEKMESNGIEVDEQTISDELDSRNISEINIKVEKHKNLNIVIIVGSLVVLIIIAIFLIIRRKTRNKRMEDSNEDKR